jgi:malate dehydrogenase
MGENGGTAMKITVIGAGHVGATATLGLAQAELANEIVVIDILDGIPQGKGLDIWEAAPVHGYDSRVRGTNDYKDTANSDLIVMTAGKARTPGMSRDDLLKANVEIVSGCIKQAAAVSPKALILMVSNPLDVMTYVAYKITRWEPHRIFGMAGILDTSRYRSFIALELDVSVRDIQAMVLGGHGDSMVPLPRYTTVGGIPLPNLLSKERIEAIVDRTRKGGAEIVGYLKTGSAYYAPGAAIVEMVESIVKNKKRILPCCTWLTGQYGTKDVMMGVPCVLGSKGVIKVMEFPLNDEEKAMFDKSVEHVRSVMAEVQL